MATKQYYMENREHILKICSNYSKTKKGKEVHKRAVEKFRENHPGIANVYARAYREKRKKLINSYKLSKGCSICGYKKCAEALEFHHEGDKEFNIGYAIACNASLEKVKKEIEKCEILCSNCHRELHEKERNGK